MKVTHIFKTYFPDTQGGLEESIRQISRYTTAHGVDNRILTVSKRVSPGNVIFSETNVIRYKTTLDILSNPVSMMFYKDFSEAISDSDILHFHFPWPFGEMNYLIRRPNIPTIVTYHSDIVKHSLLKILYRPFIYNFLQNVDMIVPTSLNYLNSSEDLLPFRDKCTVINLTIDENRFPPLSEDIKEEVRSKHGDDFFLFVGVLRQYKGLDYLLEAMKGIDRKLIVIGKGWEEKKLKQKAKSLGLKNVSFLGYVDDAYLPAFYTLCRAFVFPSINRSEAFGISLLEASSFSKPMISTELGTGTSYINKHLETGIVIPPKNIKALHHALRILSDDTELCLQYGKNAKDRYSRKFSSSNAGEYYLKIYEKLIRKNREKTPIHSRVKRYYPLMDTIREFGFFRPSEVYKISKPEKPKIVFLITEDWYFWSHRLPLARAARDAGFEVMIATRVQHHGENIKNEGFKLIPIRLRRKNRKPIRELKAFWDIIKIYQMEKPDIVHHVGIKPVLYGSWAAKMAGIPLVVNAIAGLGFIFVAQGRKSSIIRELVQMAYKTAFFPKNTVGIFQNPDDLNLFISAGIIKKRRAVIIRGSGVNTSVYQDQPEKNGSPRVVLASRMLWDKGVGEFVDAAKWIHERGVDCRFILVGDPDPENPMSIPSDILKQWNDDRIVEWWNHSEKIPAIFAESNIVVLPSYREGLPKVLLEAASCGRAIVATDVPGCREIVKHNVNGFLVPPYDSKALADAILKLINDDDYRARMGKRGRRIVEDEFSEEIVVKKTMDIYNRIFSGQG